MTIVFLTENVIAILLILAKLSKALISRLNSSSQMKRKIVLLAVQNPIATTIITAKIKAKKACKPSGLHAIFVCLLSVYSSSNAGYILLKREFICLKYDESILSIVSLVVLNLQFFSGTPGIFILASEPKPHIS